MDAPHRVQPAPEEPCFVPKGIEQTLVNHNGGETIYLVRWEKKTRKNSEDSTKDSLLWMTTKEVERCCPSLREDRNSSVPESSAKSEPNSNAPGQSQDSRDGTITTGVDDKDMSVGYDEEMKEDVRRTVARLKKCFHRQGDLSVEMLNIMESQLRVLSEYAALECMAKHFQECGAVDLLVQMFAQGSDDHWATVSEIVSSLAMFDASHVMRILHTMMEHKVGAEGWSAKRVREKQENCLDLFRENCSETEFIHNPEFSLAMPDVPVALVYSLVQQYLPVFLHEEASSLSNVLPLKGADGFGCLSIPDDALERKKCFEGFHAFNQLMWRILYIFKWYRIPGCGARESDMAGRPIVLGQSKRMRLRKKLYKSRSDFQSDTEYGEYVKSILKRGMRVKAVKSSDGVEEGDIGTFHSASESDITPARVAWENYGSVIYYNWHNLEVVPSNKDSGICFESVPVDIAAASTPSYLLCQKASYPMDTSGGGSLASPSRGSGGSGAVHTDHWWEVLSAVKALSQESQLHVYALFGAESYDELISLQPTVLEVVPVVQYLKEHHPERMVRAYSVEFLPEYQALVTETAPDKVWERVELQWRDALHTLQPGRDINPYPDPFWEEIPARSKTSISRTIQRCFSPPNTLSTTDGLLYSHTYYEMVNTMYRMNSCVGEDSSKQQLRVIEVLSVLDKVTFEEEAVLCLSPIADVFQAVLLKDSASYCDIVSALLILRLLIARMSSRVEECVLSGSLDLVLRLIELSKGSPLLQGIGLQCLNAHFNSFDLKELRIELMKTQSKGTQTTMQKGSTLLNSILAVLSSLVTVPPVAAEDSYKGHLKSMWDATLDISKYINHSLDDWMQSLFTSAISGSTAILGVLLLKDPDVREIKQEWGLEEGVRVLASYAREWDSCGSTISVVDTLLPRSMQAPDQPQTVSSMEEVETTIENDAETPEFLDVMFLLARRQIPARQFGALMTMMLKYLGVAHCRHAPHPPRVVEEATVLCKERADLFVANWGPAAIVNLLDKRKGDLRTGEAVNVLRLFVCLANVSNQMCFELVAQGLLTAVQYLLDSLCKEHSIVAKWTMCLLWKLVQFEDVRAIMDAMNVETLVSGLPATWPTLSSNVVGLIDALPGSVWYSIVAKNREALGYVLADVHDWVLSAIENGRRDQCMPAIPLFRSYIDCITEGNVSTKQVSGSNCWEVLSVSSSSYSKYKLTDGQSNTYWESSADVGKNWIHIKMKPRLVIRKLSISVSNSDRSYVPKVIEVEGGRTPSVHRINTVTVPMGTNGTVVVLKKQTIYYRHIFIRIKECQYGGAATRIRGLDCCCRPVSAWSMFEDDLTSRASIQHSINVALYQSDNPPVLDLFDRLVGAIRFEQELADTYFHTSESRQALGKAVTASMIDPTVKAIVRTGSLSHLISQYSQSMVDAPRSTQLPPLFTATSWCAEEAASLSLQPECGVVDEDSILLLSRIRRLFNFIVWCYDSSCIPFPTVDNRVPWWNAFVREELSPVLNNIKVTAPLEYITRVLKVVEKLQRLYRELFADHLVFVVELLGEVGLILKENGKAECVKFCANLSAALHTYLKDPQKAPNSHDVVGKMALLLAVMPDEVVSTVIYFYWYHLTVRILRGEMYSLAVEADALSHVSILAHEPKLLLNDIEKSANLMDKFTRVDPLEAVDCLAAHMGQGQALPGLRSLYQKMTLYSHGAFSALVLASEHCPVKLEVVPNLDIFPQPLKQFCIDYQNFYSTWHHRHAKVHERTRSLQWTLSGWALVEYRKQLYKVSTAQMLVLVQFNEADSVTPAALQAATGMSTDLLHKVLSSLTAGRDALLWWKISHSNDMGKNSVVSLRGAKGKGKQPRAGRGCIALSHEDDFGSKLAEEAFEEQGLKQLFTKRQSIIDSMVVHALKKEKKMTVDHIATLVVTACRTGQSTGGRSLDRFECTFDDILASVDRLTFSGYLERDKDKVQVLVYQEEPCDLPHQAHPPCVEAAPAQGSELAESGRKRRTSANSSLPPSKARKILNTPSPRKTTSGVEESQFSDLSFLPGSLQWSQTLEYSDLLKHIEQLVVEVSAVTSLSPSEAEVLLHHFKWNKDKLLNSYLADQQCETLLKEAGLCPNIDVPQSADSVVEHVECPVCLEPITNTATLSLTCGHKCCIDCWMGHLQTQVSFSQCLQALCPIPECTVRCTRDMFKTVFGGHQSLDGILNKFSLAVLHSYVDCHPNFTWCCAPLSCDGILQRSEGVTSGVCSKCSWSTCFCCNFTESHEPASCSEMLRWMEAGGFCEGMDNDHKSKLLERTIAKKCPKCYIPIQKNDGCLHMRCKCSYEFCWRCMKAWGPDHTDFFKCSAQISKEAEVLKTFILCNSKCMEYHKSKKFATDMCTAVLMTPVRWMPHSQLLLLAEACLCLRECYKDLAYAQVAKYLKPKDSLDYLTHQINVMESDTQALQGLLDSILVKVPPVVGLAAVSEQHRAECLKMTKRLFRVHGNLVLGAQQHYQTLEVCSAEPCSDRSGCSSAATLKDRDQSKSQKNLRDQATLHVDTSTEASTDDQPVRYIPTLTVLPLPDDLSQSPRVDSDIDEDEEEEYALSEMDDEYADLDSSDSLDNEEQYSSDGDGLYGGEDHRCVCGCCSSATLY